MQDENKYIIIEMNDEFAQEINTWKYESPCDIYSFDNDDADFEQITSGYYLAVLYEEELVGFFCMGPAAQKLSEDNEGIFEDESYTDIAFGLRPDLTGKGIGKKFVGACINKAKRLFPEDGVRLCVMNDNDRARKLYLQLGFCDIYKNHEMAIMTMDS